MRQFQVQNSNGERLTATEFAPDEPNGQVVLIGGATGVKQQFYYNFAAFLARQGFYTYTYDYCGIGLSRTSRLQTCRATYRTWAQADFPAMVEFLKTTHPGKKRHLVGHSFGGNSLGFSDASREFTSVVTVASQDGYWRNFPKNRQTQMRLLFRLIMPLTTFLCGYFPGRRSGYGEDIPPGVAADWSRVILSKNGFLKLAGESAAGNYSKIDRKMLMISIEDDWMASRKAVDVLAATLFRNARVTRRHIAPAEVGATKIGHLDFFRKKFEPTLWRIPLDWLLAN